MTLRRVMQELQIGGTSQVVPARPPAGRPCTTMARFCWRRGPLRPVPRRRHRRPPATYACFGCIADAVL